MTRHHIPLGKVLGIPIGLDYSWFLIFALLTWTLASSYYPAEFAGWDNLLYWCMGAVTAILFFGSVLLHEFGHAIVALRFKVPVRGITLFMFGGVAQIGAEPPSATAEFLIAIAGPFVSLMLGIIFFALQFVSAGIDPVQGLAKCLSYVNFSLLIFNLIPGYPLDGGRVFRAIVWAITHNMWRATIIAASAGRFFGFIFVLIGALKFFAGHFGDGIWMAFIGMFLDSAASAQIQQAEFQGLLAGRTVAQAMGAHHESVPVGLTLQELVDDHIFVHGERCYMVHHDGDIVGLITLHEIKDVPRDEWQKTSIGQVMLPLEKAKRINSNAGLWNALQRMEQDGVNQLLVMTANRIVGMLSRDELVNFLGTLKELKPNAA